jgi:DNA-binding CsgD family transcriptional regulator/PAS domain-containing protein
MDRRRSSHIVPEIYEATIDPNHWDYVVSMIAKLTKSNSACLYYKNKGMEIASTIAQYGLPDAERLNFREQCDSLDDMFSTRGSNGSEELHCTQFYPGSNGVMPNDSKLYEQWMKPNGIYHVGGTQFVDTDTHRAGIAILRDKMAGEWSDGELRVIDEVLPHLKRALNIYSEFTHLRLKQDALLKGLDRLVIGLILYDHNGKTVYINPTAQAIIEQHPALRLQDGDLFLTNPEDEKALRKTISDTAQIDPDDSWKQSVAIGITHPDVASPLPILVTPMHAHLITSDLDYDGARVAVFLSDPNLQQPISIDSPMSVYKLTPSEAQVSISLANGHIIDEIAKQSNHSAHTIRSQLKSVFRKTGVSRQSELVKLLLTGPFAQRRRSVGN